MTAVDEMWIRDARRVIHEGPTDFFQVEQRKYWIDLILCTTCLLYTSPSPRD